MMKKGVYGFSLRNDVVSKVDAAWRTNTNYSSRSEFVEQALIEKLNSIYGTA